MNTRIKAREKNAEEYATNANKKAYSYTITGEQCAKNAPIIATPKNTEWLKITY